MNPDALKEIWIALGPGNELIKILFFMHSFISTEPGSEIAGDPASVTKHTLKPDLINLIISLVFYCSVNLLEDISNPLLFSNLDLYIFCLIYLIYSLSIPSKDVFLIFLLVESYKSLLSLYIL